MDKIKDMASIPTAIKKNIKHIEKQSKATHREKKLFRNNSNENPVYLLNKKETNLVLRDLTPSSTSRIIESHWKNLRDP